jgi:hypothetical protein
VVRVPDGGESDAVAACQGHGTPRRVGTADLSQAAIPFPGFHGAGGREEADGWARIDALVLDPVQALGEEADVMVAYAAQGGTEEYGSRIFGLGGRQAGSGEEIQDPLAE